MQELRLLELAALEERLAHQPAEQERKAVPSALGISSACAYPKSLHLRRILRIA